MRQVIEVNPTMRGGRAERLLAWSLYAGAIVDVAFGTGLLIALDTVGEILGLQIPEPPHTTRLVGVLLILLAGFYALAADRVRENLALAFWAALGRLGGAAFFAWIVLRAGAPRIYAAFGAMDLAFGLVHGALAWGAREGRRVG